MADPNKTLTPEIVESKPANDDKATKQKNGNGFVYFLLLIILVAAAASSYYFWHQLQLVWQQLQLVKSEIQVSQSDLQSHLTQLDQTTQTRLLSLQDQQKLIDQQLKETQELSQQAIKLTNRNQKDWVLAEIDYLLRLAHRRLQIARDINGAIAALTAANQRLFDLGDLTYFEIRKQLNIDIASLKALHQVDINGTALALDQIITVIDSLPFKTVQAEVKTQLETSAESQSKSKPEGFVDSVLDTMMSIGDIKIHQRSIQPASSTEQQQKIEQLLRTYLISSRLAVLRFDDKQFSHDIEQSLQLIHLHYKSDDNRVSQITNDLLEFKNINLSPELPDISQSWKMLQELNKKQGLNSSKPSSDNNKAAEVL